MVGTYNRFDLLKKCVDSVVRETKRPFHLYVTDAGSSDGTIEYLKSIESDVIRPVFVGKKIGQARAYNDVFKNITTPFVCWLSDDNEVVNAGLDIAASVLSKDDRIGMVALKVRDIQGPFIDAPYIGGVSSLGILNVNQGMLPTPVLKKAGYFSEGFRDYGIDPDLTAKVLMCGYDIAYTRHVAIHHYRLWEMDKTRDAYWDLRKRQECSVALYEAKYGSVLRLGPMSAGRKAVWYVIRKLLGKRYNINGRNRFFGLLPRDWHNIVSSRFVSLLDPVRSRGKPYHLRQYSPLWLQMMDLPTDHVVDRKTSLDIS